MKSVQNLDKYLIITFTGTFLITLFLLGELIIQPNSYFFSAEGDGLQAYYQSEYHLLYDSTYWHQDGMFYPHGESIFFTGGQPIITNPIKLFQPIVDLSDYIVGITNLLMLSSIWLCAIFIYLVFREFDLGNIYGALLAIGLTFLTQQWDRMGGHYPLAYLYAIPGMLYFLIKQYRTGMRKWSIVLTLYVTFLSFCHIYYLLFFSVMSVAFWIVFSLRKRIFSLGKSIVILLVPIVVPYLVLSLLIAFSSSAVDRTSIPWGFLVYKSGWSGYLFPYGMWYENVVSTFKPSPGLEWEGLSYLGAGSIILIPVTILLLFQNRKELPNSFSIFERRALVAIVIAIIVSVALSFAFPFNLGLEDLLSSLGKFQQFRGIGRFALVAFYLINILLFCLLWKFTKHKRLAKVWFLLLIGLMFSEGYNRTWALRSRLANSRENVLKDIPSNVSAQIVRSDYQAILPLPFFLIGSENIGMECNSDMKREVYDLSIKSGLPMFSASMSRSSISNSFKNIALAQEFLETPSLISELMDSRPILLMVDTNHIEPYHRKLIEQATLLLSDKQYRYFKLPLNGFEKAYESNKNEVNKIPTENFFISDNDKVYTDNTSHFYFDSKAVSHTFTPHWWNYQEIEIPKKFKGDTIICSFWIEGFSQDLVPRSVLAVTQKQNETVTNYYSEYIGKLFVAMKDNKALVEVSLPISSESNKIFFSIENKLINGKEITIDNFLMRSKHYNCFIFHDEKRYWNNRTY